MSPVATLPSPPVRDSVAGCFLTLVRRTRALAPRLAPGVEREGLLLLLAVGEIAAWTAGAFAGLPDRREGAGVPLDAAELIRRALQRAAPAMRSLATQTRVRSIAGAIPVAGPCDGLVRGLTIAVGCAAVASGSGGTVGLDVAVEGRRLSVAVRGRGREGLSRQPPLPFSPAPVVAALLAREGGRVRAGGGSPPRSWRLDVPLAFGAPRTGEGLVASFP
ncbi:MAG TPA: hypothetical protein VFI25_12230 [Planctomycetota bacterium]|jgi:hypothetical protein|nr:hypothetical protein [Planctomycetota bacterium]